MGQIADDYINGACCSGCESYFLEEHGYPVLCEDCWEEAPSRERREYQKAHIKEIDDATDAELEAHGFTTEGDDK